MRVGVDLGGTKIATIAFDPSDNVLAHERVPTPHNDYDAVVRTIKHQVQGLEAQYGVASVGIGMPGSINPTTKRVQNANSTWMNGKDFQHDLEVSLDRSVKLANDANCFALSEAVDGAGNGAACVFGVILGTGCGGGVVINGQLLAGPHNIAGEWGHNPLPWQTMNEHPGPVCWCGRSGCLETWISGSGLERDHSENTGQFIAGENIVDRANDGDREAQASLARHADRLARGLSHVVNLIDTEVIVLGGGLSNLLYLYEKLPDAMKPYVFCDSWSTAIKPPVHGDDSGVRGAARLWPVSA